MKLKKNEILQISAYIKYLEYILGSVSRGDKKETLENLHKAFEEKFKFKLDDYDLLSQHFGIIRLITVLLMKEHSNQDNKVKIIRHSLAHGNWKIDEKGYTFFAKIGDVKMSFNEFNDFIFKLENNFYKSEE